MLIYRESGIFAHKKTIKQFLQLMIEQVLGGGGGGGDVPLFCVSFSELLYFCVGFFQDPASLHGTFLFENSWLWLRLQVLSKNEKLKKRMIKAYSKHCLFVFQRNSNF